MKTIDLNCDLGEAFGNYSIPNESLLMECISSANIACGFHAGDFSTMEETVKLAINKGVAIGAHPGLPDLQGFGRREMKISAREAYQLTLYQIGALYAIVKVAGGNLHHVKPHGALYNMAAKDLTLAEAISNAIYDFDDSLVFYGLAGSKMITAAKSKGLRTASEVFADRTYQDNGMLTPRNQPNALITDKPTAVNQILLMIEKEEVVSVNKQKVEVVAETVCLHGDGEHAVEFAKEINQQLKSRGIAINPPIK
ncbi:MAG: LamB/YcsF family protein [Pedobacter sp.]|nr:MAG: LamB/YcsF family protein [Pedobacter sp.]